MAFDLPRRLFAEWLGTGFLLATVVGSGIMGERLADGNMAIALLGNTVATGAILMVLILVFGPVSGAHFNPAVTIAFLFRRQIPLSEAGLYILAQAAGGLCGTMAAHGMFELPVLFESAKIRTDLSQWWAELVATFGLVATILGCIRFRPAAVPYAVGLFITAGYWFTASTSFANPAVTLARGFTDTFSGIRPVDVPGFVIAQIFGGLLAAAVFAWLLSDNGRSAREAHRRASEPAE